MLDSVADLNGERRDFALDFLGEVHFDALERVELGEDSRIDRRLLLWTTLLLEEESLDPRDLARELAKDGNLERAAFDLEQLADEFFRAGQLTKAEQCAALGLEAPGFEQAWKSAPALWLIRAEVARKEGRWGDLSALLDRAEAKIPSDAALKEYGYLDFVERNHNHRALLYIARARSLLEVGVLDRVRETVEMAREQTQLANRRETLASLRNLEIDLALLAHDFQGGAELAAGCLAQAFTPPWSASARANFLLAEGVARCELDRRQLLGIDRGSAPDFEDSPGVGRLLEALESPQLEAVGALKAATTLADGALQREDWKRATVLLERAKAMSDAIGESGQGEQLADQALLAALRWRLARGTNSVTPEHLSALEEAYRSVLNQWQSVPPRAGGIGFLQQSWRTHLLSTLILARVQASPDQAGARRALDDVLAAQAMGTRVRQLGLGPVDLASWQAERLGPGRGLLMLIPARDESHLFLVGHDQVLVQVLPPLGSLRALVAPVYRSLLSPERGADFKDWLAMRDALFDQEALAWLEGRRELYALGFDRLAGLPLDFLPGPKERFLGETHAVSAISSLALEQSRCRRLGKSGSKPPQFDLNLLVDPRPHGEEKLVSLPFGDEELLLYSQAFQADRVNHVLPASIADFAPLDVFTRSRITHLMAHGDYDTQRERGAVLRFASSDSDLPAFFGSRELEGRRASGVVILASCNAARAPERIGDDALAHLGGALLDAGASCVILTRHPVQFQATVELFALVHERLAAGDSPAEALRFARAALSRASSVEHRRDAFRRASFQVLGAGFEAPLPR